LQRRYKQFDYFILMALVPRVIQIARLYEAICAALPQNALGEVTCYLLRQLHCCRTRSMSKQSGSLSYTWTISKGSIVRALGANAIGEFRRIFILARGMTRWACAVVFGPGDNCMSINYLVGASGNHDEVWDAKLYFVCCFI
jgi:hypothetical protein